MGFMNKTETYANGKMICADFSKLDPQIFLPLHIKTKEQLKVDAMLVSFDGKLYINKAIDIHEALIGIFNILIPETRYKLEELKKYYKEKFPNIKSIEDVVNVPEGQKIHALTCYLIPVEIKRREIERNYYKARK